MYVAMQFTLNCINHFYFVIVHNMDIGKHVLRWKMVYSAVLLHNLFHIN